MPLFFNSNKFALREGGMEMVASIKPALFRRSNDDSIEGNRNFTIFHLFLNLREFDFIVICKLSI